MTTPVFLLIEATPNLEQKEALQGYLSQTPEVLKAHGGVPVAKYDIESALDGDKAPAIMAVMSFPHREAISQFFDDVDYQALIPLRNLAFSHVRFFIGNEKI